MKLTKEQEDTVIEQSTYANLTAYVLKKAAIFDTTEFLSRVMQNGEFMYKISRLSIRKDAEEFLKKFKLETRDIIHVLNLPEEGEPTTIAWKVFTFAASEILNILDIKY